MPKKDYWTERGFSSREQWLEFRNLKYRSKNSKECQFCSKLCWGNRVHCSNKCKILSSIEKKENGCWQWVKCKSTHGYGIFKNLERVTKGKKNVLAHRASFIIFKGEIPKGKFICHSCDSPACCNPDHLWIGSCKENVRDALKKNRLYLQGLTFRLPKGGKSPASKLEPYLQEIRERICRKERIAEIAEFYNVTPQAIYSIKNGLTWKDI